MKIVYWAHMALAETPITKRLNELKDDEVKTVKSLPEVIALLPETDGLIAPDPPVREATELAAALRKPESKVRWLHIVTAGREGFNAAKVPEHVVVTGPAGAHSAALAEHAMAFILSFTRCIPMFAANMAPHVWDRSLQQKLTSVEGRTLAVIGQGHAGRELAKRAKPFGMTVIAATRTPKSDPLFDDVQPLSKLRDVLGRADFIAVMIALAPETRGLIGAAEFTACKPTAYLVNVARGAIIDQAALNDALRSGKIAGAGIDVTTPEPLPKDDPLWDAPNLIISPHLSGGGSSKSMERLSGRVIENLEKFRNGTAVPT